MSNTYVFFKELNTDTVVSADLTKTLNNGESITNIVLGEPSPKSSTDLEANLISDVTNPITKIELKGGDDGVSYGIEMIVTTTLRVYVVVLAISVHSAVSELVPYASENPDAFKDLIGDIEAGNAAIGTAVFSFPPDVDPSSGYVVWEMLSSSGTIYASGNAFEYNIQSSGFANVVLAKCVISVPSNVPPNVDGDKYQLRYTLFYEAPSEGVNEIQQIKVYSYEQINVTTVNTVPLGTQHVVELQGDPATVSLVTEQLYDRVGVEIQNDNQTVVPLTMIVDTSQEGLAKPTRVSSGWYYAGVIDTSQMPVSLEPYVIIWKYWNSKFPTQVYRESAKFWVINSSLMNAVDDVKAKINKARTTLYGEPDLLFPASTVLTWMRRGRDSFNGYAGVFTSFSMLNAKGAIREYWLMFSEIGAIEAQYLAEGEKAFDYQGAAIQLSVDRTQYLDSAMGRIQGRLDNEFKPFKQVLVMRGNTSGDGSVDPSKLQRGAIGAVGITITPVTPWSGRYVGWR